MATDATPSTAAAAAAVATASSAASAVAMEAVAMRAGDAFWGPPAAAARAAARGVPAASGRTLALDRRGGRGAGALAPSVRRAACPPRRQQCKCRRLPVAQALAAATVVVEVLVVSCVRGGYRVRANQVLHGCPIRYVSRVARGRRSEGCEGGAASGLQRSASGEAIGGGAGGARCPPGEQTIRPSPAPHVLSVLSPDALLPLFICWWTPPSLPFTPSIPTLPHLPCTVLALRQIFRHWRWQQGSGQAVHHARVPPSPSHWPHVPPRPDWRPRWRARRPRVGLRAGR